MATGTKKLHGGGCTVTPAEKLKASQTILPPLVIGENEDNQTSLGVWIYGANSNPTKNSQIDVKTIIAGFNTTISTNINNSNLFVGMKSKISDAQQLQLYGVTMFGRESTIHSKIGDTAARGNGAVYGVLEMGYTSTIEDAESSWHPEIQELDKTFFATCGVTAMGANSVYSAVNQGVLLFGRNVIHEMDNYGIVLSGRPLNKKDNKTRAERNRGIIICGYASDNNEDEKNSTISFSQYDTAPTLLKNNVKLDQTFNLQAADGTYIIKNGQLVK